MNYAIILAGGMGTRFWPLSRQLEPKQILNICSRRPMIEETIGRVSSLIRRQNIYIATNKLQIRKIRECTKGLNIPLRNFLLEPEAKNTLAPIAVLCRAINEIDPQGIIVALPCDHFIKERDRFVRLLKQAIVLAGNGQIVTLGIKPKRPETGYGYIEAGTKYKIEGSPEYYAVGKFIEKPHLLTAGKFIKDKRYYWNSGVFVFRSDIMLGEIKKFMPETFRIVMQMRNKRLFQKVWHKLPSISLDYAIMQRTKKTALLPANYNWADLGSWDAVKEVSKKNKEGNIFIGNCLDLGSRNSLIWSQDRLVATLGLDNVIIVDTKDALLVCSKDKTQDVKKIVQILKKRNLKKQI